MAQKAPNNGWWRGGVIHQIYPRSYQDTNADGIGDLPGITRRLDHIAALGTDGIWLSPFFKSPMKDFGYDVSDHCDVDPMFGTLDDFKALVSRAHALGVGEIGDHDGLARVAEYTSGGDKLHMTYCFDLLNDSHDAPYLQGVLSRFLSVVGDGWPCWAPPNHDCVRSATRWGGTDPDPRLLRLMAAFQVSLRGSVCLYQGEELGLPEANVPFEDLREPYGINMWPEFKGRDGCRTPMPWASTEPQAGFSAAKPWLPAPPAHTPLAADAQQDKPDSLLTFYTRLLHWRRGQPALVHGDMAMHTGNAQVLAHERSHQGQRLLCVFNFSGESASWPLPPAWQTATAHDIGLAAAERQDQLLVLQPWGGWVAAH